MDGLTRRDFLKKTTTVGTAAGLGLSFGRPASAAVTDAAWGALPVEVWPAGFQPHKVLEIHLFGGVAPFESFYYRDTPGRRTRGFDTEVQNLNWNGVCPNAPTGLESFGFSTDSLGRDVNLGPFSKPLWLRQDIRRRMRVLVEWHDLMPHEAAIPYTVTGLRLGRPNFCSLGATIQHRRNALDQLAGLSRALPHSYGLFPQNGSLGSLFSLAQQVLSSLGTHPGSSRPLVLRIGPGLGDFVSQLDRLNLGATKPAVNALIDQYRSQYRDWIRWQATTDITRSPAFRDYDTAATQLIGAGSLKTLLNTAPQAIGPDAVCAREGADPFTSPDYPTKTALEFAAFLLSRPPAEAASYVYVLDAGLVRTDLPYDVHSFNHAGDTGSNLSNLFSALTSVIRDPANPGPADANKMDLTNTLIIINTDFGRTPFKSNFVTPDAMSMGRDHWPEGYVNVYIGGPIPDVADGTASRVVGAFDDSLNGLDVKAVVGNRYSATDSRAAAMIAAGIHPFVNENLAVGQLTGTLIGGGADVYLSTMINLRQTMLGVA